VSDRIDDARLDSLIRIQDALRCKMNHMLGATAADDGYSEGNVHAGVYRALVELKERRADFDAKVQEVKELQVEIAHWRATVSESDAHLDLWRRRAEACGWPTEADMDAARGEPT
jgi:hypothetical protein